MLEELEILCHVYFGMFQHIARINIHISTTSYHTHSTDGRKAFPINHGPSSPATLLEDACRVVRAFMDRDPEEVKFTIVALTRTAAEGEEED